MGLTVIARPPARKAGARPPATTPPVSRLHSLKAGARAVDIPAGVARLKGTLTWPCHPSGFVLVTPAPTSLEDVRLAARLRVEGLGTLRIDRIIGARDSDPELQPGQLRAATEWLVRQPEAAGLPMGCLSVGAGAGALVAAGSSAGIGAVVSYGGDPGRLGTRLYAMRAPTLLIVGDTDYERLRLAYPGLVRVGGPTWLVTIPGTGPLQDGHALDEAGRRAAQWFVRHLVMEPAWRAAHPSAAHS